MHCVSILILPTKIYVDIFAQCCSQFTHAGACITMNYSYGGNIKSPGPFADFRTYSDFGKWVVRAFHLSVTAQDVAAMRLEVTDYNGDTACVGRHDTYGTIWGEVTYNLLFPGKKAFTVHRF